MRHETSGILEIDTYETEDRTRCWCGEERSAGDVDALGVSFCSACRARVLRSCASILAIANGRAVARRRRR